MGKWWLTVAVVAGAVLLLVAVALRAGDRADVEQRCDDLADYIEETHPDNRERAQEWFALGCDRR